jgi:type I restriction enzyme S subunit
MSWNTVRLSEVTTKISSGATPQGGQKNYVANGISLIRSMNVYNNVFNYSNLAHIADAQASKLNNVSLQSNDILLNITGASVARSCVTPDNVLPARVNQHVSLIRCKKDFINPIFLNYLFTNKSFQNRLLSISEFGGATRQAITNQQIKDLVVIVPPLCLQNRFAEIVQAADKSKFVISSPILSRFRYSGNLNKFN